MTQWLNPASIDQTLWLEPGTNLIHIVLRSHAFLNGFKMSPINQDAPFICTDITLDDSLSKLMNYIYTNSFKYLGKYSDLDMESFIMEQVPEYDQSTPQNPRVEGPFQ